MYTLEQGPIEQTIIRQCIHDSLPLPEKIKNAPQLGLGLELYYIAFFNLESCRLNGVSIGRIPWTAVQEYCISNEFSEEQVRDTHLYLKMMDNEYIKFVSRKNA